MMNKIKYFRKYKRLQKHSYLGLIYCNFTQ